MKYFTPELYLRGQSTDNGVNREVDRLWEQAVEEYERHLQDVQVVMAEPVLPPSESRRLDFPPFAG
jgi:hypothetical protein